MNEIMKNPQMIVMMRIPITSSSVIPILRILSASSSSADSFSLLLGNDNFRLINRLFRILAWHIDNGLFRLRRSTI